MKPFRNPFVPLVQQPHTQPDLRKMEAQASRVFHSFVKVLERLKPPPPSSGGSPKAVGGYRAKS